MHHAILSFSSRTKLQIQIRVSKPFYRNLNKSSSENYLDQSKRVNKLNVLVGKEENDPDGDYDDEIMMTKPN